MTVGARCVTDAGFSFRSERRHRVSMSPMLTVQELAAEWRVHPESIRRWTRAGLIAGAERTGRHWRFRRGARFVGGEGISRAERVDPAATPADFSRFRLPYTSCQASR